MLIPLLYSVLYEELTMKKNFLQYILVSCNDKERVGGDVGGP